MIVAENSSVHTFKKV